MKLPAIAIAAFFAAGIAFGLIPAIAQRAGSHIFLAFLFAASVASLLVGILLTYFERLVAGGVVSLLCWGLLGLTGACVDGQPRPANAILSRAEAGTIGLSTPLRYYGKLRDEPEKLPWGVGYDIALSGVDYQGEFVAATGGLRVSYATHAGGPAPMGLHAGDGVSVLTQAKLPQMFRDEGAFDRRAYLAQQGIDLVATLRAPELLEITKPARPGIAGWTSRARRALGDEIDAMWATQPRVAGVLRAMLLGDRSFVERDEAINFQKTGAFHVLVVAGLHVGAFAVALFWIGRRLRLPRVWTAGLTLLMLLAYVSVVEQRAPVLRAGLMAAIVVMGGFFFRRLELLNSAAVAALVLLVARPMALGDASFQLSFLAIGCIAGLAIPWLESTVQPYARCLRGWRDVSRDAAQEPRAAQLRIDLRSLTRVIETRMRARISTMPGTLGVGALGLTFRVWELLVLTLVLQMGMLPLLAGEFHRITLSAPLANFAAVPLTALIVPGGFLTLIAGALFPPLRGLLAVPLSWLTQGLLHAVAWCAHFQLLSYRIPGPPGWLVVSFLVTLTLLMVCLRVQFSRHAVVTRSLCVALAFATVLIATFPFGARTAAGKLEVSILDVGQGDSLLVVSPGGKTLLIDGGGAFGGFPGHEQARGADPGEEAVSPYLWGRGFKKIDVVALTHAHQDHLGGLNAILESFRVGRLWIGREVKSPALAKLESLARERNIPVEYESRSKGFSLDGVEGQFLWPEVSQADAVVTAKNNDSLVLRLKYRNRTLLLPGDAEKQAEQSMLAENSEEDLHADVLKVGHHGSKNSTTQEFLEAVRPQVAIISAGEDNPYGHPSPELLERLQTAGVRVLRTDRNGAVHILTDGDGLEISCFVACGEPTVTAVSKSTQAPD